jgi:hypothetical protein
VARKAGRQRQSKPRDLVTFWLWDAPGPLRSACGVSTDRTRAQQAARDCLASGQAATALVQEAELVTGSASLAPRYQRIGGSWQARRTSNGAIRWQPPAALAAS